MPRGKEEDVAEEGEEAIEEDDELDEQLLKVVGGGSKKEKKSKKSKKDKKKKKSKKKKKKKQSDSEEEEGELSDEDDLFGIEESKEKEQEPSVPLKKRRFGDEPATNEFDSSEDEYNDGYDENLIGDEEDRKYLFSLSEVQREDILAERYQKRKQAQERRQLRNKLKRDRNLVDSSSSLSNRRASKRVKSSGSEIRADALSDLISKRSQRAKAQTTTSDTEYDRIPKDDDSDTDFVIQEDKKPLNEISLQEIEDFSALPASLADIEKIRLSRSLLEQHFNKPKFNKLVVGFFIRIGLGMTADHVPVYRVTTIAEVKEHETKTYKFGKATTNKFLLLKHGSSTKLFSMESVSNQPFTESEFNKWKEQMNLNKEPFPTVGDINAKLPELEYIRNYTYTDEDVKEILAQRRERKRTQEIKFELLAKRDAAKDAGNMEEYEELSKKLEELEATQSKTTVDKVALINMRNKMYNIEAQSKRYDEQTTGSTVDPDRDPFSRRQTRPTNMIELLRKQKNSNNNNAENGEQPKEEKPAEAPKPAEEPQPQPQPVEDDIIIKKSDHDPEKILNQVHDFAFDITIVEKTDGQVSQPKPKPEITTTIVEPPKKTISLLDYKIRRGLV